MLKVPSSLVDVNWLYQNLHNKDLVVLNSTIKKKGVVPDQKSENKVIPNTLFFDLKSKFSDKESMLPNTFPKTKQFQDNVRNLGVHQSSCIVIYDELGVYSSPRAWWLFKSFGFQNVAVLNGGLPAWKEKGYLLSERREIELVKGNFVASLKPDRIKYTRDVLEIIENDHSTILDARSATRFNAVQPEPRADLKGGHIPNSISLPYSSLLKNGKMKSIEELKKIFKEKLNKEKPLVFTCGSGITACVLVLGAHLIGYTNLSVYDGSWTEWASTPNLPIKQYNKTSI